MKNMSDPCDILEGIKISLTNEWYGHFLEDICLDSI